MAQDFISLDKNDAREYSFILRSANVSYHTEPAGDVVRFHLDDSEDKIRWMKKLADDMHVGMMRVSVPSAENFHNFMNALDQYNLVIAGDRYTWLSGKQYIIKGHEGNLAGFHRYLKSM